MISRPTRFLRFVYIHSQIRTMNVNELMKFLLVFVIVSIILILAHGKMRTTNLAHEKVANDIYIYSHIYKETKTEVKHRLVRSFYFI
jgi:hypothetical protein